MDPRIEGIDTQIEAAFADRDKLKDPVCRRAVLSLVDAVDRGQLRVADPINGEWVVNEWIKKGILLYFAIQQMTQEKVGPFEYHDKIPLKPRETLAGVRALPGSVIRKGAFVEAGAILMPSFVNIGAFVGAGTMVDTWATVGSCAQVGRHVHLSGGVGIGGVLEPPQAVPVIIEDNVFVGSRAIVVEGVRVREGAVLGAGVVLTASTKIIDVSVPEAREYVGEVPPRSVVIPGTRPKRFPGGEYGVPCALIIGTRKKSTDEKTSLNDALRDFDVPV